VVLNKASGIHHVDPDELRKLFAEHYVLDCEPEEIPAAVKEALRKGTGFIGVAGGDGTIRGCAEQLVETETPLLAVPAGTRNHFAHQLGIPTVEAAAQAPGGLIETVDVGVVNGRVFVNNAAIGLYAEMVDVRERYQSRGFPKRAAQIIAAWHEVRHGHRFNVTVDGQVYRAWLVFIGNGAYGEDVFDLGDRQSIADRVLDVRIVRADRTLARTRVILNLITGRLHRSPLVIRRLRPFVDVDLGPGTVEVALDGEVEEFTSPLHFESRPMALRVLVPHHEQDKGPRMLGPHRHEHHLTTQPAGKPLPED
jgi:diacylglycerol kinase family enzyme